MSDREELTFEFADFAVTSNEFYDEAYLSGRSTGPVIVNPSSDNGRSLGVYAELFELQARGYR